MEDKCERIANHGCNLFINRQLIYNYPEQVLMNKGVTSIEHADFDGVGAFALVTGGEICSTFDDASGNVLGTCDLVEEIMIGEDKLIKFSGVAKGEACTIVLRGASSHVLGEAERSLHDSCASSDEHGEGLRAWCWAAVARDGDEQSRGGARREDFWEALARHGGLRQGAQGDPHHHLRERGPGLLGDCLAAARVPRTRRDGRRAWTSSPGTSGTWRRAGSRSASA